MGDCQFTGYVPGDHISFVSPAVCHSCGWEMPKFVVDGTYAGHRPSADGSNRVVDFIVNDHRVTCPRCNNKEREIEVECCAGGAFISLTHSETVADGIEIDTVPHAYATQRIAPHEIG